MATEIQKHPFNKLIRYKTYLPTISKNNKRGFGTLLFMMNDSFESTTISINDDSNMVDFCKLYRRYYIPMRIRGKLGPKVINYYEPAERKLEYETIKKVCPLIKDTPIPVLDCISHPKNCYFAMHNYINIYNKVTNKMNLSRRVSIFWSFMDLIWHSKQTSLYTDKYVLIDLDRMNGWTGKPQIDINNISYLIYYTLYRYPECIPDDLSDLTFVLYTSQASLKVNLVELRNMEGSKGNLIYKKEVLRLLKTSKNTSIDSPNQDSEDKMVIYNEVKSHLAKRYRFIGDAEDNDKFDENEREVGDKINKIAFDILEDNPDVEDLNSKIEVVDSLIEDRIDEDKELISDMYTMVQKQKMPTKPVSSPRDKMLLEKQKDIKVGGMTLKDINKIKATEIKIPENDVSNKLTTSNKNLSKIKYANLDKTYIEEVMKKDIVNALEALNDKSIPIYIRNIEVDDTSTPTDLKETWTVSLEDANRQRHTLKIDIPKFIDNRFMYIGGNKVIILKQNFFYPVVKTSPDTVIIVTDYNRLTLTRYGKKNSSPIERFNKLVKSNPVLIDNNYVTPGNVLPTNTKLVTTFELDQLSKQYAKCKFGDLRLYFSINEASKVAGINSIDPKYPCIGLIKKEPILLDVNTGFIKGTDKTIMELIEEHMSEDIKHTYQSIKVPKNLSYTIATIMKQDISFIALLGFWEGLSTVLKKANISISTSDKRPNLTSKQGAIQFNDCWMIYDDVLDKGLLLNGLTKMDTQNYSIADFDTPEPYVDYFAKRYGKQAIINTLINAYEFTLDPITLEILDDIGLPKDLVELCLYANSLLSDNNYKDVTDQSLYRIRSNEIISGILYKQLSNAYINYKNSNGKKKFSLPKDAVIKHLLSIPTVKDYSTLNPGIDVTDARTISAKGFNGTNLAQAYNLKRRGYNDTMRGVIVPVTSNDGNVGVNRFLAYEPNIINVRGYCEIVDEKDLKDVNMQTADDMMYPLTEMHDDAPRTAMTVKQTNHMVPTKHMSPVLISSGAEETMRFNVSSDFAVNAEEDGVVKEYDEKNQFLVVEYKSGKRRVVDLGSNMSKNGGGGFYMKQQKITNLREGDKFKKNDCLAWHKDYFTNDPLFGPRLNAGTLVKIAITTADCTYEDSSMVTKKIAEEMATAVVFKKSIVIGKNANLEYMVNIGDHLDIGDTICQYDTSFEDSELNKLLKGVSDDLQEEVISNTKNNIKAKKVGEVVDIKIYSPVDLEEMSPSLKKYCSKYYSKIKSKYNKIKSYANSDEEKHSSYCCDYLMNETTEKIEPNKFGVIRGEKVNNDSILIEVYIEHADVVGIGDKLTVYSALKSTVGTVVPEGLEPYSDFRPDEELSYILASCSVLKRMVSSINLSIPGNKVLVELKRKLKEIYDE